MEELPQEGGVNPYLLLFLDAESYTEKLNVLSLCKDKLDDSVINAMAASMEIEVPDGPIENGMHHFGTVSGHMSVTRERG